MLNKDLWLHFPPNLHPPAVRSLSLMFILEELKKRFEQVRKFQETEESLTEEMSQFLSLNHSYPQMGMFPDKLCFYCDILLQASKIKSHSLRDELDEMRASILQFRSQRILHRQIPTAPFFSALHQKLCSFFIKLVPFLHEARTDENILLTLIEQRHVFNRHLGLETIEKLLQNFSPSGHAHLKALISEGFIRRGFSSFLAEKEHLIEEIEWENACRTTRD